MMKDKYNNRIKLRKEGNKKLLFLKSNKRKKMSMLRIKKNCISTSLKKNAYIYMECIQTHNAS